MQKIDSQEYGRVRPLMGELADFNVSVAGVLSGNNPGTVYVDDPATPQVMLMIGPEGTYLTGKAPSDPEIGTVKDLIADLMAHHGMEVLWLQCSPAWEARLAELLPLPPLSYARQHYVCTDQAFDWRTQVPEGFRVHPITQELLDRGARGDLEIPDHIYGWMQGNWGSNEDFLARGFGFVTEDTTAHRIVSWSLCDCIGDSACEIGIQTHVDYRQRGLAALTAAAAVDYALTQGFQVVGWHCNRQNIGSQRTALRAGFRWERDYVTYGCFHDEAVHKAETERLQQEG